MLWKSVQFFLAENQVSVGTNLEDSATTLDQTSGHSVFLVNFGRQTGGLGRVVSLHAVFDTDLHNLDLQSFEFL